MDSKELLKQDELKTTAINQGGIQVGKNDQDVKNNMNVPESMKPEMEKTGKKAVKKTDDNDNIRNSILSDIPLDENMSFIEDGGELFGMAKGMKEIDEREIILDGSEALGDLIVPMRATKTRLNRYGELPVLQNKDAIKAGQLLSHVRRVVKNGNFDDNALNIGNVFLQQINEWAGIDAEPKGEEAAFYNKLGQKDTLGFLYVDGKPLKEFVSDKYGYEGSADKNRERSILSAYVAMIASRQNHAITLVRPVVRDGVADVDIRNVPVNALTSGQGREAKTKAARNLFRGEDYRRYCETAFRSEKRAEAGNALRAAKGKEIENLKKLENMRRALKSAGKGKHRNYDDFVRTFNTYFDALEFICLDPDHMEVTRADLMTLRQLGETAKACAIDYLKGKKMNLDRHLAVRDIRDLLAAQTSAISRTLRGGSLNTKDSTVSLKDVLDSKEEGFVVVGIEDEIDEYREDQEELRDNKNEYAKLEDDAGLSVRQKQILRMKSKIDSDEASKLSLVRLINSTKDQNVDDETRLGYAFAFLKAASSALLTDEVYGSQLRNRYKGVEDDTELLLNLTARDQLYKAYSDKFKTIPALQAALDVWNEQVAPAEAMALSYKSNVLGKKISQKDFKKHGGSCSRQYMSKTESEAVVNASHGYIAVKAVKGRPNIVRLVPTLPEYKTINRGKQNEKQIPLRKTIKTVYKTFISILSEKDGTLKKTSPLFGNIKIAEWMDLAIKSSKQDPEDVNNVAIFFSELVRPEMEKLLTAEYKKKGIKSAKNKAQEDAATYCDSFIEFIRTNEVSLSTRANDVSFADFVYRVSAVKNTTVDEIMNHKDFKDLKIGGKTPTREEVSEVIDEFKKEIAQNEKQFTSIINSDNDDPEMPCFTSCNDYCQSIESTMVGTEGLEDEDHSRVDYSYTDKIKADPIPALDFVIANLDRLETMDLVSKKTMQANIKKMREIDEKRKKEPLSKEDISNIWFFAKQFAKYEWHRGGNLCKVGNVQYTTETFANDFDQIFQSPLTIKPNVGRYISQKELPKDEAFVKNEGMNAYYDYDDAFSSIRTDKQVLRYRIKDILFKIADKERNKA